MQEISQQDIFNQQKKVIQDQDNFISKDCLAYFLVIISCFFWVFSYIYPNQKNFHSSQNNLLRGCCALFINGAICMYQDKPLKIQKIDIVKTYIRSIVLTIDAYILAIVQFFLPLPIVHTLGCSGTVFVFILDYYINGAKLNKKQIVGIIICFFGVILVANGRWIIGYIFQSYQNKTLFINYISQNSFMIFLACIATVINMLLWAYACLIVKQIKSQNSFQLCFHTGIIYTLVSLFIYIFNEQKQSFQNMLIGIFSIGIPSTLNLLLTNMGFKMSNKSGNLTLMFFSTIIFAYFLSIFRYEESQNPICSIGILLTVFGIGITIIHSSK